AIHQLCLIKVLLVSTFYMMKIMILVKT
ncbi:glycosyl transferase 2 family protein, partial [Vibrio parahaemolyticus 970107]